MSSHSGRVALVTGSGRGIADAHAAALGPIDVLIDNAGISPKSGSDGKRAPMREMTPEERPPVLDVDLTRAFNCTRAVVPGTRELGRGRTVSTSSVAAETFRDIVGVHYAATKAGLIGSTKHLAGELGPFGVTVNAVAPGRIDTPPMRGTASAAKDAVKAIKPPRRFGTSEDVADTGLFLTSDAASFVTAQVIDMAGGLHIAS
jgi:3-oxoacyl-[acyl-carrier protein] reductase